MTGASLGRVAYRRPGSVGVTELTVSPESGLPFGRAPGENGLLLDPEDNTLSSNAGRLLLLDGVLVVANTSTFATIRVEGFHGFRYVHPGERAQVARGDAVVVPTDRHEHRIEILEAGRPPSVAEGSGGTIPVIDVVSPLTGERRVAVAALVAGWFLPSQFDPAPLSTADIARLMSTTQRRVTTKAVNHKLQRVRDALSDDLGVPIDSRAMLADLVLQHRLVTLEDVRALPGLAGSQS